MRPVYPIHTIFRRNKLLQQVDGCYSSEMVLLPVVTLREEHPRSMAASRASRTVSESRSIATNKEPTDGYREETDTAQYPVKVQLYFSRKNIPLIIEQKFRFDPSPQGWPISGTRFLNMSISSARNIYPLLGILSLSSLLFSEMQSLSQIHSQQRTQDAKISPSESLALPPVGVHKTPLHPEHVTTV